MFKVSTFVILSWCIFLVLVIIFLKYNLLENKILKCKESCEKIEYKFDDECNPVGNSDCEFKCRINILD